MSKLLTPDFLVPLAVLVGVICLSWACRKQPRYCRGCDQPVSACRCGEDGRVYLD